MNPTSSSDEDTEDVPVHAKTTDLWALGMVFFVSIELLIPCLQHTLYPTLFLSGNHL